MKLIVVALVPSLGAVIGIPLGAIIFLVWPVSLHGPSFLASACGGLIPEKCGRAVLRSIGLAAWGNPGSGFDSHSWAWGSRGGELSILTNTLNKVKSYLKQLKSTLIVKPQPKKPSNPRKMNHLIFTAVLTACLGIGGYQQGSEFFGPSPEGLGHDPQFDPGQLNSSHTGPWPALVFPHSTLSIAVYTTLYYILTYFAGSFGRYNVHAKVFCWLMTIYPIVTALTGFQFVNLLPYILQVVPTILGYYICQSTYL
ncbi:hypothetical protein DSO57_1039597 [Entomophthora muscae]|uniref:Uncharacterized protein n=1 Tax=Entomophthora muscae TaxID=34485 RepID=A0ACC2SFZ8_9FUNG|nr:hypothetical protein DSO57_1039597 [Entomophthora muscae]